MLLRDTPAEQIDTTLIVHPDVLTDFLDYNDFLDNADAAVEALDLQGVLQVASFHPDYQFAGAAADDHMAQVAEQLLAAQPELAPLIGTWGVARTPHST